MCVPVDNLVCVSVFINFLLYLAAFWRDKSMKRWND